MLEFTLMLLAMAALAGLTQGLTGFGYSLVLVSLLTLAGHELAGATILASITCLFCQGVIVYRLRGHAAFRSVWTLLIGGAAGVPVGVFLLGRFGQSAWLLRAFGLFVLAVSIWLLLAPRRPGRTHRPRRLLGLGAGLASGLGQGLFNTGGPPAVLYTYSRPIPLDSAKATVQWLFMAMATYRLAVLAGQGMVPLRLLWQGLLAAPLVAAATLGGLLLARRIHPEMLRRLVFVLLTIIGAKLAIWPGR